MAKKMDPIDEAVDEALARFGAYWGSLSAEEQKIAENVTVMTAYVGGRKAAAEIMGVGLSTLDNYRSGKTQPKYLELLRLLRAAQDVQKEALVEGRMALRDAAIDLSEYGGERIFLREDVGDAVEIGHEDDKAVVVDPTSFAQLVDRVDRMSQELGAMRQSLEPPPPPSATLKFYPHAASAGWGQAVLDDEGAEDLDMEHFVARVLGLNVDYTNLVPVKGESMYPTLQGGDYAIIDRRQRKIIEDELFVFSLENDLYIKRAKRREDGSLCWISDNPDYPPMCLQGDEISRMKVVGRVTNVIRSI